MVASVSANTGRTVLFSLPRNLQHARSRTGPPLPSSTPTATACEDQSCLLNAVHALGQQASRGPVHRDAADPGIAATRAVVAETLGLGINYYAMVDMRGFENLIDALGGIRLDIAKAVPIGGGAAKVEGYIQPGRSVHLNGFQALWFARSRHGSSDYERMTRQKCVINALAKQANPVTVATRFTALAEAGGAMVTTDIPGGDIARLLELAASGRSLPLASTAFSPPLIEPSRPDIDLIRRTVAGEIAHSQSLDAEAERQVTATPDPVAATASAEPAPATTPEPSAASPGTDKPVVGTKAEKSRASSARSGRPTT
jgi:LCP family protein required for cell wall assembly